MSGALQRGLGRAYVRRYLRVLGLLACGCLSAPVLADCAASARTALEHAYCDVVAAGGGQGLPRFEDFRRNTPRVQVLLLKRPARRVGVAVPEGAGNAPTTKPADVPSTTTAPSSLPARPAAVSGEQAEPEPPADPVTPGLARCQLAGDRIDCPDRRFQLARNQPNHRLAEGVLAAGNRLGLATYQGDPDDEAALRRYLSDAYDRYIHKMLGIGLGGVTLSFTEFYHGYHRHQASGVEYAQRLEHTFQLLKQDKRTRAVPARLSASLPEDLAFCDTIAATVVVCDGGSENWVFVAP